LCVTVYRYQVKVHTGRELGYVVIRGYVCSFCFLFFGATARFRPRACVIQTSWVGVQAISELITGQQRINAASGVALERGFFAQSA
jgi:hypothetical protein